MNTQIEIEFRALLTKDKYEELKNFLRLHSQDLGEDDKDVYFFILPDKLVKVVNNISKKDAKFVIKLNKIGKGADFEEIEIPIQVKDIDRAVKMFTSLGFTDNIMHSYQRRHNYLYKNVELALKYSDVWGYHLELEIVVPSKSKKVEAEGQIKKVAKELDVQIMTDEELIKFTGNAEQNYKKNKRN